jgi:hypothetical protein
MSYRQILNHYYPGTRLTRMESGRIDRSSFQTLSTTVPIMTQTASLKSIFLRRVAAPEFSRGFQPTAKFKAPLRGVESRALPFAENGMMTNRGIQKSSLSSEHFRATYPVKADRQSIENMLRTFESARADLLRRLEAASLRLAEPGPFEVVIHATTADFIAATGQGGWAAGATRGRRIELQPLDLLRRRGVLNATLRHEMAHAVIEVLGGGRAPRWMAEGLAIHIAGEAAALPRIENKSRLSRDDLERKLMRLASVTESRKLYAMAYHEVRAMIEAEGEAGVWRRVANTRRKNENMSHMNQQGEEASEAGANHSSYYAARFHSDKELIDEELRCVQCDTPVKDVVCGHRNPCPFCGFPYPVGDCSDLVEN